jgi:hypothetical protein
VVDARHALATYAFQSSPFTDALVPWRAPGPILSPGGIADRITSTAEGLVGPQPASLFRSREREVAEIPEVLIALVGRSR